MSDSRRGFGFDIRFIDHPNTQFVIALNYSASADFHTLNKSLAHTLGLFQPAMSSLVVAWKRLLTMTIPLLAGSSLLWMAAPFNCPFLQLTNFRAGGRFTPASYPSHHILTFSWPASESESYITTDGQSTILSWNKAPIWGLWPDFNYCQTVTGLLIGGALSDERTGLSFTIVAGSRQCSHFRVRILWYSWPYFTVSDLRLPFSSPPTTRGATVEVFDLASPRDWLSSKLGRAIAQAVSRWLPTAGHVGFVVGQSGAGAGFLRVLRFPLQSSFAPPITPQSPSCIIWGMHNRPMWPQCWDL
jgi:hypothetical protein